MRQAYSASFLLVLGGLTAVGGFGAGRFVRVPQEADAAFNTRVSRPAYTRRHPRVLFDVAHNNAETPDGRYRPFVALMKSDGFAIVPNTRVISRSSLLGYNVLVIVNATGAGGQREAGAFTSPECDAIREWVNSGGSLLLIADHEPFSTAVSELAGRFGVEITRGHTIETVHYNKDSEDQTELVFSRDNGLLGEHAITRGRDARERTNRIITFSGTSLRGPPGSVPFLKLSDTAMDVVPPDRKPTAAEETPSDHKQVSAAGRAQGLALEFGKGRVVVLSEAATLTAQVARGFRFGMNVPGIDNRQLALNIMHWLSRLLN